MLFPTRCSHCSLLLLLTSIRHNASSFILRWHPTRRVTSRNIHRLTLSKSRIRFFNLVLVLSCRSISFTFCQSSYTMFSCTLYPAFPARFGGLRLRYPTCGISSTGDSHLCTANSMTTTVMSFEFYPTNSHSVLPRLGKIST